MGKEKSTYRSDAYQNRKEGRPNDRSVDPTEKKKTRQIKNGE